MITYTLFLINSNPKLNLTKRSKDINEVFKFIHNGGTTGRKFRDIEKYKIVEIKPRHILVKVSESSNSWHRFVGFFLANKFGMRTYCDPKDSTRMFKWKEI